MYEIVFSSKSLKQLKKLPKTISSRIIAALERAQIRPEKHFSKLVGDDAYKLRVGSFRVLADIDNGKLIILVLKVDHRKRIYKN